VTCLIGSFFATPFLWKFALVFIMIPREEDYGSPLHFLCVVSSTYTSQKQDSEKAYYVVPRHGVPWRKIAGATVVMAHSRSVASTRSSGAGGSEGSDRG
jgi:hypothetical protein